MTAPWTNAVWFGFASLQGPSAGLVAVSWYGVASPCAVNGLAGTMSVQFMLGAATAAAADRALKKCDEPTAAAATSPTLTIPATAATAGVFIFRDLRDRRDLRDLG
jgi:hypothetical protein